LTSHFDLASAQVIDANQAPDCTSPALRPLRLPCDIRAGARDWRLWDVQLQFERPCDGRNAGRCYFLHGHWHFGRRDDFCRREFKSPIVRPDRSRRSIADVVVGTSKRYSEATYLTVLPGLAAVLYFVAHPYSDRNAVGEAGLDGRRRRGPGILGLVLRDSRRWVYRGTEFSAGRPDSSKRSDTGA
jgi:hypothetical protein